MPMDADDHRKAQAARKRCILRRPVEVAELTIAIAGLEQTHWRRLVIPIGWSLRGTADLLVGSFNRSPLEEIWFEAGSAQRNAAPRPNGERESPLSHVAGDSEPTFGDFLHNVERAADAAAVREQILLFEAAPLNDTTTRDVHDAQPRRDDRARRRVLLADRTWLHRIDLHERRREPGTDPVPRCVGAAGCNADACGLCNAEFIERLQRWRDGKRCRDSYERLFRDDEGDPDRADIAVIDFNLMGSAAPVWKRLLRLMA
jgi:hypothetical protein